MTLATERQVPSDAASRIAATMALLQRAVPVQRRIVHGGDCSNAPVKASPRCMC